MISITLFAINAWSLFQNFSYGRIKARTKGKGGRSYLPTPADITISDVIPIISSIVIDKRQSV